MANWIIQSLSSYFGISYLFILCHFEVYRRRKCKKIFTSLKKTYLINNIILQATNEVQPFQTNKVLANDNEDVQKVKQINHAKSLNKIANFVFIMLLTIFNIGFWTVVFLERSKPAEYYITEP